MAPILHELVIADPPDLWREAGFAVDDEGISQLGTVRVRLVGNAGDGAKGVQSWALWGLTGEPTEIDCIPTRSLSDDDLPSVVPSPGEHPNGTLRIDHLVLMTHNRERTVAALEAVGISVRRVRDAGAMYDVPRTQTFFRLGEVILELIAPGEPEEGPCRFYGLALDVADIDALPAFYGAAVSTPKEAVQEGRRIATLRHKELGLTTALAFMTPVA